MAYHILKHTQEFVWINLEWTIMLIFYKEGKSLSLSLSLSLTSCQTDAGIMLLDFSASRIMNQVNFSYLQVT
jgi:hypothetical protein